MLRLGLVSLILALNVFADFHPADTNLDSRITAAELSAAHDLLPNSTTSDESLADTTFAQAWFIWRAGETYTDNSALSTPFRFLPDLTYVSLSERNVLPLTFVEIIGLSGANGPLTGRFRPVHTSEWLSLDVDEVSDGSLSFRAPYVPSPWLPSRDLEIEFTDGQSTWKAGILRLKPIDRSGIDIPGFLEQTANAFAALGDWNPDETTQRLADQQTTTNFEKLMGYYHTYSRHTAESYRLLQQSPPTPDSEIALLIGEEVFALSAALGRTANLPRPELATPDINQRNAGSDCVAINDWTDLVFYTARRASLEEAANDESLAKEVKDKAFEKLTEAATKLGERLASDAGAIGKRAGLAVTIPLELYSLLSEWERKTLPKNFIEVTYELKDGFNAPLP